MLVVLLAEGTVERNLREKTVKWDEMQQKKRAREHELSKSFDSPDPVPHPHQRQGSPSLIFHRWKRL